MRKYITEHVVELVATCSSLRGLLVALELKPAGGNYESIKKFIQENNIDTSHFTGQKHLKGKTHDYKKRPLMEVLVRGKTENTWRLKNRLLSEGVKSFKCERCGLTKWIDQEIPLELHHIDGDRTNNTLLNLSLLCPNCHAMTDNYRGKNKRCRD